MQVVIPALRAKQDDAACVSSASNPCVTNMGVPAEAILRAARRQQANAGQRVMESEHQLPTSPCLPDEAHTLKGNSWQVQLGR